MSRRTHEAVMTEEVLENLVLSEKGLYVDCTFGAGGHSSKILEKLNKEGKLLSMDKDINATNLITNEFNKHSREYKKILKVTYLIKRVYTMTRQNKTK